MTRTHHGADRIVRPAADLPRDAQRPDAPPPSWQIVLQVTADRRLSLNSRPVGLAELEAELRKVYESRRESVGVVTPRMKNQ